MELKIQYTNDTDKQTIINANSDKFLIKDEALICGKFLTFSDIKPIENIMNDIKNNTDLIILKQEGIV